MSRYNQFAGTTGALKIKGAETPEGVAVLALVEPIISSWTAHCRLQAEQSSNAVSFKYLNHRLFTAAWQMIYKQEVLAVNVYPPPNAPPERLEELVRQPPVESFTPPKPPSPEEPEQPVIEQPTTEEPEIKLTSDIKCLVVLFNDNQMMALNMGDLGHISTAKPLIKPRTLTSNWALPFSNDILNDGLDHAFRADGFDIPVLPNTLQMTNSRTMGPVAIAGISISAGVITASSQFHVFRLAGGFGTSAELTASSHIGNVGVNGGFPALMATDNMIYACNQTFQLTLGALEEVSHDAWGYAGKLATEYVLTTTEPFFPNFIDSDLNPHFDAFINNSGLGAFVVPALGSLGFAPPPNTFVAAPMTYPALAQVDGVDVLTASQVPTSSTIGPFVVGGAPCTMTFGEYSFSFNIESSFTVDHVFANSFAFIVPYSVNNRHNIYYTGAETGAGSGILLTMFDQVIGEFSRIPGGGPPSEFAYPWQVFNPLMQVSNGHRNLQGFAVHSTAYPWDTLNYFFYLDGVDVTATLAALCGVDATKIQYAFMDVPLPAAAGLK